MDTISLVVAEHGADWLGWAQTLSGAANNLVVLVQDQGERPVEFAKRVTARVSRLRREGGAVTRAAFAGSGFEPEAQAARSKILRKVSAALAASSSQGQLYLDAREQDGPARPQGRNFLRALAWALSDMAKGSGLSISVGGPLLAANA